MCKTRTIINKHKTYEIPIENEGTPIEQYFPNVEVSDTLQGARVYQTEDGAVIAQAGRVSGELVCGKYSTSIL